jgi:serine/threonine protein kinase
MLVGEGRPSPDSGRLLEGRYLLGNLLGEGGMGKVFEATCVESGGAVAVKILRAEAGGGGEKETRAEKRFQIEAEAASALDHPGVVKVHEFRRSPEGQSYIVMERLHGATFDELRRAGKLGSIERVVELVREACGIIEHAHRKGIVHRDLKPSNLFLHRIDKDASRVKVFDFGVAKILDRSGERLTGTGEFLGTLLYMAPEQTAGRPVTTGVDVYSLGVILFEALTGLAPFAGRTPVEILRLHASTPVPPLSAYRPEASQALEDLVARCLVKRPENRFRDAGELARALASLPSLRREAGSLAATTTLRSDASSWVGLILEDRYQVEEWLAPGRFGSDVYRAIHLRTGVDVAVRLWRTGGGAARECLREAFQAEARAMGVRHPNLIAVLDLGHQGDGDYIVTELVESSSLRSLLERKGRLDEAVAVRLARGAAGALGALHEKGIISGGLSPETLRVASGGDAPSKLLLTPFGLMSPRQVEALLPPGRRAEGDRSLDYLSPEQGAGASPDPRSDLYSLALILLEMLAGEAAVLEQLRGRRPEAPPGGGPRPARAPAPALRPEWAEFFRRALARRPEERFATAEDLAAAIPGTAAG